MKIVTSLVSYGWVYSVSVFINKKKPYDNHMQLGLFWFASVLVLGLFHDL